MTVKLMALVFTVGTLAACGKIPAVTAALQGSDDGSRCTSCRIFVTSSPSNGNFGGISGADLRCATDSNKPSAGFYKALVVGSSRHACTTSNCVVGGVNEHLDWVMKPDTTYMRTDGTLIGMTNSKALLQFSLSSSVDPTVANIDTGLNSDSTNNVNNCSNWNSSSAGLQRAEGRSDLLSSGALAGSASGCGYTNNIYCVEQ